MITAQEIRPAGATRDRSAERIAIHEAAQSLAHTCLADDNTIINACEQERMRLSRELHDDIAQRIALVSAELTLLRQRLPNAPEDIREHVASVGAEVASIGSDLHRIARGLHPAGLERLGLEASIRHYCTQLAHARGITIELELSEVPAALDMDTGLCVYRIVEEALHNVVKHSGASRAVVSVTAVNGDLVLRIVDGGVGFDPQAINPRHALGLISMRERARLVDARLLVSSTPGAGTVVEVHVPIPQSVAASS